MSASALAALGGIAREEARQGYTSAAGEVFTMLALGLATQAVFERLTPLIELDGALRAGGHGAITFAD